MSVWVFGVDFRDDFEYDEDDWYQEWETYGDDYEFVEQIEGGVGQHVRDLRQWK